MDSESNQPDGLARSRPILLAAILGAGLLWSFWPVLAQMVERWERDARYSHGFLVPLFSLYLLYRWSPDRAARAALRPSGWGLPLIAAGVALQLVGARYYVPWFEAAALLPALAGLSVLLGGWRSLLWTGPSIGFLFFMIPLPYRVEMGMGYPLQRIATLSSNYALQTLGFPAVAEGNVILLDEVKIGVVEACNGLGMLFTFFAFAVGMALVVEGRSYLDRALIVLSAIPIALLANVTRITATGVLYVTAGSEWAEHVYHNLAGWLMMPLALAVLGLELVLLSHLFINEDAPKPAPKAGKMAAEA